jgi:hypothetical protein
MNKEYFLKNFIEYLTIGLGILFILLGSAILYGGLIPRYIDGRFQNLMGIVLIAYGTFKIVLIPYRKNMKRDRTRKSNENDDENEI